MVVRRTQRPSGLDDLIAGQPGVGPALAPRLERLGLVRLRDILFHLPHRYQDRTRLTPIGALSPGLEALVEGEVLHSEVIQRRRRMLVAVLYDGTASLTLRFFHFDSRMRQLLSPGNRLVCFGEARRGGTGMELVHPQLRAHIPEQAPAADQHLTPVYPTTEGVTQTNLRRLAARALQTIGRDAYALIDWLPQELRCHYPPLLEALRTLHAPAPGEDLQALAAGIHPAQRRLALEELIAQQLGMMRLRHGWSQAIAPRLNSTGQLFNRLRSSLPFQTTGAQERVIAEIATDLGKSQPMLRLVQGDVGSGKTLVAAAACLHAIESGHQAALMAPTELLAEQHYRAFSHWLIPLGINVAWISGSQPAPARRHALDQLRTGAAALAIGTHALVQGQVEFNKLGLAVIDEQHRFGVHQRWQLQGKNSATDLRPHQLIMTATPIPRTLAMTAYAGLEQSVIDELPKGRSPVKTVAIPNSRRDEILERVRAACRSGQQAYWVCTLIEESEMLECQAAEDTAQHLAEHLPELRLGLVHGRLKSDERAQIMQGFRTGTIDLLIATTVIEVGVDVPNATLMIIENAERLGLAQLHQLRGRVGRGSQASYCVLMYQAPLGSIARQRLDALRNTTDGFEIARIDLELRGPGEILGTRQSGELNLRIADLVRDQDLLAEAQTIAHRLAIDHPDAVTPLIDRWAAGGLRYAGA